MSNYLSWKPAMLAPTVGCFLLLLLPPGFSALEARTTGPVVGTISSKKYHVPTCGSIKRPTTKNRVAFDSPRTAEAQGYVPCKLCDPNLAPPGLESTALAAVLPVPVRFATAPQGDALLFTRDVGPTLVANCLGCHNERQKRGGLDMTTFRKLMAGGESGPVIVAGKPEESELILRVSGESTPKMPPGNNRNLADPTIARLGQWIKDGALLDNGVDADAPLAEIASTPDQLKRAALEKLTPEERDALLDTAAADRWKKVLPDARPERVDGDKVAVFSLLPNDRAERLAKAIDKPLAALSNLLSRPNQPVPAGPQKISVYVFNDRPAFTEFVRTVLQREVDDNDQTRGDLKADPPFLAALDPLGGHEDPNAGRRPSTTRKDAQAGPERGLEAIVVEGLAIEAANAAGKPPQWLALGLGEYMAAQIEPRSPRLLRNRAVVADQFQLGWMTKSQEALGDNGDKDTLRAMGYSLFDFLAATNRPKLAPFTRGMLDGGEKLDDGLRLLFGATRQDFLTSWGRFVAAKYGRARP